MSNSVEEIVEHFDPLVEPDRAVEISHELRERCPVTHSDQYGGFWVVSGYEELFDVLSTPRQFESGVKSRLPAAPLERPFRPPIDSNLPEHRWFRELINPYLSPKAVQPFEPQIREQVRSYIASFAADGECELGDALAKPLPPRITFRHLFGIDDQTELDNAYVWARGLTHDLGDVAQLAQHQANLTAWTERLIAERRASPPGSTLLDALVFGSVNGRPLSDDEISGAIQILVFGGFLTTSDAMCNIVIQLAETPGLQDRLRSDPGLIPVAIEEVLRLEPPITALPRVSANEQVFRGCPMAEGDLVLINFLAANRDPSEFDDPDDFRLDRSTNRHLSFGGGIHRCVGSNLARLTLRVVVEELVTSLRNIRIAPDGVTRQCFLASLWRTVGSLRIEFDPID